ASPQKVVQPTPQALPSRSGPNSILVSPRQKGNPILTFIKSHAWEYSDIPSDYVMGATTCALFLSLKYHRLHPEYIYNRIRALGGKYLLRVVLVMVDIDNHEESLRELSKTSLINNVTLILCWSAQEAGRYLEQFKTYENAPATQIKAVQSTSFPDRLVDFITVPRSINKTDAVGLVSNFGSLRTAVGARPEEISLIAGWGDKKVKNWCAAVNEPFRKRQAARKSLAGKQDRPIPAAGQRSRPSATESPARAARMGVGQAIGVDDSLPPPLTRNTSRRDADRRPSARPAETLDVEDAEADAEGAMREALLPEASSKSARGTSASNEASKSKKAVEPDLSEGVMAALAKLRDQ
ncbi:DNA repair protein rad10, partial [Aulographum hederae CBS 113979]